MTNNSLINLLLISLAVVCITYQMIWITTLCSYNYDIPIGSVSYSRLISGSNNDTSIQSSDDILFNTKMDKLTQLTEAPTNIYVLGERNSGTNYAAATLRKAFTPPNKVNPSQTHEYFSANIPVLRHKHMFRHTLLNETELTEIANRRDILWIFAVRSPCEWAEAMKRLPWHVCKPSNISKECPGAKFVGFEHQMDMRKYTLAEFFQLEWGDWPESTNFRNMSFVGKDFMYKNIFKLRKHKLMIMRQIMDTVPRNVKIIRLHELEKSPEIFIQNLLLEFKLTLKKGYTPQLPSTKLHTEKCLSREEWDIAQKEIDWQVESNFGYSFLDCHLCY